MKEKPKDKIYCPNCHKQMTCKWSNNTHGIYTCCNLKINTKAYRIPTPSIKETTTILD